MTCGWPCCAATRWIGEHWSCDTVKSTGAGRPQWKVRLRHNSVVLHGFQLCYMDLWKVWKSLEKYGKVLYGFRKCMKTCGKVWFRRMGVRATRPQRKVWLPHSVSVLCRNLWKSVKKHGKVRKSMGKCGKAWKSMEKALKSMEKNMEKCGKVLWCFVWIYAMSWREMHIPHICNFFYTGKIFGE